MKRLLALMLCAVSLGLWGQCADGEVAVDYSVSNGTYPSEISWQLNDASGTTIFSGGAGAAGTWCLAPGDYTFIGLDSYGDGWNGATATFFNATGGFSLGTFVLTSGGQGSLALNVSLDVPGCTDPNADNYNPDATVDDGSCCLDNIINITLYDTFGDGWSWAGAFGGLILNGDSVEFVSGDELNIVGCFAEGCNTGQIVIPAYASEGSWVVTNASGVVVNSGSGVGEIFFWAGSDACVVAGCTDEDGCNYNPAANLNDGSCEYLSCAGCTDPIACNYDETATLDDASCEFSCIGCFDVNALNYCGTCTIDNPDACIYCPGIQYEFTIFDSYGDGFCCAYGEGAYSVTLDGEVIASGGDFGSSQSVSLCAENPSACVVVSLTPDNYPEETSWQLINVITGETILSGDGTEGSFATADCVGGCNDAGACNYDPAAAINDGTCDYSCYGCTEPWAVNYNPEATVDSGDCVYCDPGTFILTVDMFDSAGDGWNGLMYGIFGDDGTVYTGSLDSAFLGDGLTSGTDLICLAPGCYSFQTTSGINPSEISVTLSDQFGIAYGTIGGGETYGVDFTLTGQCDISGCTNTAANNFNPSASIDDGSCECDGDQLDALGECFGPCEADADADGICDDVDPCVGQLDALGECFGPCEADADADGICDDVDPCVGQLDECGVCNGPGAIFECGCADIPEGFCDCDLNQLDALGVCGGDCSEDANSDGICDDLLDCFNIGAAFWQDLELGVYISAEQSPVIYDSLPIYGIQLTVGEDFTNELILNVPLVFTDEVTGGAFQVLSWSNLSVEGLPPGVELILPPALDGASQACVELTGDDYPTLEGFYEVVITGEVLLNFFGTPISIGDVTTSFWVEVVANPNGVPGCIYPTASNYMPWATYDSGACEFAGCTDPTALNYSPTHSVDDGSCFYNDPNCVAEVDCAEDLNGDGAIGTPDLLLMLSEFGNSCD